MLEVQGLEWLLCLLESRVIRVSQSVVSRGQRVSCIIPIRGNGPRDFTDHAPLIALLGVAQEEILQEVS
jgi:hypothetical protein